MPVYICVRDRLTPLRALVEWLEKAGHGERLTLVDNGSSYPPLLDYLQSTSHCVVQLGANLGSRALWVANLAPNEAFVWTDPDVVPTGSCPLDAVAHLQELLDRHPTYPKAGLGFYLDDFPPELDQGIVRWERSLTSEGRRLEAGVYSSLVDTSFALYRPNARFDYMALRTGAPYLAHHLGWAAEANPTDEDLYYLEHADAGPLASSWKQRVA